MFWNVTHNSKSALAASEGSSISIAGKVIGFRKMGGVSFGRISDIYGSIQFLLNRKAFGDKWSALPSIKTGDIVGLSGALGKSSTGELTILVSEIGNLQVAQHPYPDKWNGISDPEVKLRKRYLDCQIDSDVAARFLFRSRLISSIRSFLEGFEFIEIETPTLCAAASGASAKPFVTHHNALDAVLYLRIAPETYLKRAIACGFPRVFEIGKQFRNEGIDPSHLQEFTSLEWYSAYDEANDNLDLFKNLLRYLSHKLEIKHDMFSDSIPEHTYSELFLKYVGADWREQDEKNLDNIFKEKIRPHLNGACFVKQYPAHLAPLAARNKDDNSVVDMWQFICNGWELVKCYTELTDPSLQRKLLLDQVQQRNAGNEEAMMIEEDFLECMEYGMPPMSGLGLGIDRLIAILTNSKSLKDVVLFPLLLKE